MRARHDIDFVVGGQTEPVDVGIMQVEQTLQHRCGKAAIGAHPHHAKSQLYDNTDWMKNPLNAVTPLDAVAR